jgi:hypothetical protein
MRGEITSRRGPDALLVCIMFSPRSAVRLVSVFGLMLGGVIGGVGCNGDDEIGTPCETDEDCSSDLICDVHEMRRTACAIVC